MGTLNLKLLKSLVLKSGGYRTFPEFKFDASYQDREFWELILDWQFVHKWSQVS